MTFPCELEKGGLVNGTAALTTLSQKDEEMVRERTPYERSLDIKLPPKLIEPLFDQVLIHPFKPTDVNDMPQVILPDNAQESWATTMAAVIAIGPDCKSGLKEGDRVLLHPGRMMIQYRYSRHEWRIVNEKDIAAKIPPSSAS